MSDQSFIILNDVLITGVQSVSFQTNGTEESTFLLHGTGFNRRIAAPLKTTCTIKKFLANNDFLKSITGVTNISGQFIHGEKAMDFTDAVISSYNFSVSANSLPSISFDIAIYGDFKPGDRKLTKNLRDASLLDESGIVDITSTGVNLVLDNTTNFVQSFNYSASFNAVPTYEIDSIKSSTVKILPPIQYSANASLEFNDETLEDVTGLLENETFNRTVTFTISGDGEEIASFEVPGASLKDQSISQTVGDTEQISLSFVGYSV